MRGPEKVAVGWLCRTTHEAKVVLRAARQAAIQIEAGGSEDRRIRFYEKRGKRRKESLRLALAYLALRELYLRPAFWLVVILGAITLYGVAIAFGLRHLF